MHKATEQEFTAKRTKEEAKQKKTKPNVEASTKRSATVRKAT
ncbi:hypothetical protein [Granulicella arctica]|uniref:Uncharacterized protein n=1 Tax=Granulicella arctica TaxID=940613 RepID=A0A7Y9THG2_9BACT|nr:hypothetical protein [Granulicella arctica]NYF79855.1 hypothetical protein [Granulicella arctica]